MVHPEDNPDGILTPEDETNIERVKEAIKNDGRDSVFGEILESTLDHHNRLVANQLFTEDNETE